MGEIIARWEWRTFGTDFGGAEEKIRVYTPGPVRESAETYLLSANSGENTKIRNDLMDIKTLKAVEDGLEQWFPLMKAGFPLEREAAAQAFTAWKVPLPKPPPTGLSLETFLTGVIDPHPDLTRVAVTKERHGFTIKGAIVEIAELTVDGEAVRTIAAEHADPVLVRSVVEALGLSSFDNVNYMRALKRFKGLE